MDPLVFALVGAAAVLHVSWNVLIKTSGDPRRASTLGMAVGAAVVAPLAVVVWLASGRPGIPADAAALAVVSGLIETVYFVLLSAAYRRGDLSVVYPIARGTAPLLAVLVGWGVLGEQIRPAGWLGVALLLIGMLAIQRPWRVLRRPTGRPADRSADLAVAFALLTGLAIVAYSAVDRVGVRLVSPWLYAGIMWPVSVAGLVAWAWLARHEPAFPPSGERRPGAVVGLLTLVSYVLVLLAYTLAPLAVVAALRESAIVLASGWGAFRLAEAETSREAALRVGAAAIVLAGAAVLAFGA
ncbi:MAG: DMT family transporter [Candidatus Limnocylindrales bacterium]